MSIRREDKEFIQAMAILGSLLGVCIGVFLVMHLRDRACKQYAEQTEYRQTHEALAKLTASTVTPNNPMAHKEVFDQVQQHIEQDPGSRANDTKNFWLTIPRWGLWSLYGVAGATGAIAGYIAIWITGWAGSIIMYQFLRLLYAAIRKTAPHCAAAAESQAFSEETNSYSYQRDNRRILPTVVKLFFFLMLILILLTIVVWHLTNL